jgi:hypothetical protein
MLYINIRASDVFDNMHAHWESLELFIGYNGSLHSWHLCSSLMIRVTTLTLRVSSTSICAFHTYKLYWFTHPCIVYSEFGIFNHNVNVNKAIINCMHVRKQVDSVLLFKLLDKLAIAETVYHFSQRLKTTLAFYSEFESTMV